MTTMSKSKEKRKKIMSESHKENYGSSNVDQHFLHSTMMSNTGSCSCRCNHDHHSSCNCGGCDY